MMRTIRIALAQINPTVGDLCGNVDLCLAAAADAGELGADIIVFPELALAGYPPEDLLLKPGFLTACRTSLERFAVGIGDICAVVGTVEGTGPVHNAAAVVHRGRVQCMYRKMFLPNYGVFDEKRYFSPGTDVVSFMMGDVLCGLSICEDTWVPEGPHCVLGPEYGVDVILNLSSSPFHAGKGHERAQLLEQRSRDANTAFVYVNLVGGQDELVFDGGSLVYGRDGGRITAVPSFVEGLFTFDLAIDGPEPKGDRACVRIPRSSRVKSPLRTWDARELSGDEEILNALVIGTRDYFVKNGFTTAVIGLSGGIDSALVAAVAVEALGRDYVVGVTMPSRYTSAGTRGDAGALAENLGIRLIEIPIMPLFTEYAESLGEVFAGREQNVTEENLQARIRGTLLMALSNKFGWLVLTTGNKSEMATGYATLYGDMAGGFAVIKDVPKTTVYRISHLINERAGRAVIPESIITRAPSAELRPDQTDQDSLPPYDILDPILKAYIEDDLGVEDIGRLGFDHETVRKVVHLVDISEYKRRQAPPGVKITPRAFGRDRRLPITNRFRP